MNEQSNTCSTFCFTVVSCSFCLTISGHKGKKSRLMFLKIQYISSPTSVHPVRTTLNAFEASSSSSSLRLTEPSTWDSTVFLSCCSESYIPAMFNLQKTLLGRLIWDHLWCTIIWFCVRSFSMWYQLCQFWAKWFKASEIVPSFDSILFLVNRCCGKGKFHPKT